MPKGRAAQLTRSGVAVAEEPSAPVMELPVDVRERVERVLEAIRPAVKSDGGDLELVEITDDRRVRIRMLGACVGCPSSMITLKMGVERNLKLYVPEVVSVEAVP